MIEPYLRSKEVAISVMLPGKYAINGETIVKNDYWCLNRLVVRALKMRHLNQILQVIEKH